MLDLQQAGFPFDKNDITIEQWKYIAELKTAINNYAVEQSRKS
jgi:hypothetical protein